jgi:glutathione S-transferase
MILIGQYDSPFVRRVGIALTHYGLAYEHRPWSTWADAERIAAYNPLRRVPVLVTDEGEALTESFAILDAIDATIPEDRALVPREAPARRQVLRVCALATGLADKAVSLFYERLLHADDAKSAVWTERCTRQIRDTLDVLEAERAARSGPWWMGERLSHADVAVACAWRFTREAHAGAVGVMDDRPRPALAGHSERCEAMPVFQAVAQPFHVAFERR